MPSLIELLPTRLNLEIRRGDDFSIEFEVMSPSGAPIDMSGATVSTVFLNSSDVLHNSVSGNVISVFLSDTETLALSKRTQHWEMVVTVGADTRGWLSGRLEARDPGANVVSSSNGTFRVIAGPAGSLRIFAGHAMAVAGDLAAHIANPTGAHAASAISNVPAGDIAATNVQAAINELDTEKLPAAGLDDAVEALIANPASDTSIELSSQYGTATVITPTGTASTDTAAIQAALNAGGDVYINGDVTINATLSVTVDRTRLDGNGTITATGLTSAPMIEFVNVGYCYLSPGLFFDGNWASGIIGADLIGTLLSDINLKGDRLPVGMRLLATDASGATQNTALNNITFMVRNGVDGMVLEGKSGQPVANNQINRFDWWSAASVAGVGIDFVAYADNNYFRKGYISVQRVDSVGMAINSTGGDVEVYENHFDLIIESTLAAVAIDGNRTWQGIGDWTTFGTLRLSGGAGISLDIAADCDLRLINSNLDGVSIADHWINRPERIVFSGVRLGGVGGSPANTNVNRHILYALDASNDEWMSATTQLPRDWTKVDIVLYWDNRSAGSGDVAWSAGISAVDPSSSVTAPTMQTPVVVAAAAQNQIEEVTLASGLTVDAVFPTLFAVQRDADNTSDTLANDVGIVALIVQRAI